MANTNNTNEDRYTAAEAEVAEAAANVERAEQAGYDATMLEGQLVGKLNRGDESVTAMDLAASRVAEERARYLFNAAKMALQRAERKGPFRPTTAAAIAHIVAKALDSEVRVVDAIELPEVAPLEPYVLLRQTKRTESPKAGAVAGTVDVAYVRGPKHASAIWKRIADVGSGGHQRIEAFGRASRTQGKVVADLAEIEVTLAFEEVPALERDLAESLGKSDHRNSWDLQSVAGDIAYRAPLPPKVSAKGDKVRVIGSTIRDGEVLTIVEGVLVATISGRGYEDYALTLRALTSAIETTKGLAYAGLGRCVEAEVGGGGAAKADERDLDFRLTFRARVA